ncbi:dnaJ homolog subfamily B member 9-like [Cololabis saira]|uniref:dnaJ homolog subfamily B member 9-like n=1 Tax=Cololabis saira TaxID=129043 RepID=UPI002AD36329|nr:dnaJ homolog subfamily B member 9-like [Cololabis saira]
MAGVFHWTRACVFLWLLSAGVAPADAAQTPRSYYDILSVEQTATGSQIKKSFRRLAVRYHPDKNKSTDAEGLFREIVEAYSVLNDKEKRKLYDRMGHEAFLENEAADPEENETSFFSSFSEFLVDLRHILLSGEPHTHWSLFQDEVPHEHYTAGTPDSFYFEDMDENEEEYLY